MLLRVCIAVPVYNNPKTLVSVVQSLLSSTALPVWVIDDGSFLPCERILRAQASCNQALNEGRLKVFRQDENQGKGAAIQLAFEEAIEAGYTHLLTFDGDGQHLASEVPKLLEAVRRNPFDLVIGSRDFSPGPNRNVPGLSSFGRKFSNFWVRYQTGQAVEDSQSGLRVYPLFCVQTLSFFTRRYDFEIEVLIRLLWRGVKAIEVKVDVVYPKASERVSHFKVGRDNARISLLNTWLVTYSLFRLEGRKPLQFLHALALGAFIGVLGFPLFWTLALGVLASLFLRCALLFILVSSVAMGALSLAPALLIPFGLLYIFSVGLEQRRVRFSSKTSASWSGKMRGGVLGNLILQVFARTLGKRFCYGLLVFIIPYFYLTAPTARRGSREFAKTLYPDGDSLSWTWFSLKQLYAFGTVLFDRLFRAMKGNEDLAITTYGAKEIEESASHGKGNLFIGAHLGGWDMVGTHSSTRDYIKRFNMVQFESAGLTLNKLKEQAQTATESTADKFRPLYMNQNSQPIFEVRELLGFNESVGFLADRPMGGQYELVPFLGKLALFDGTPFKISAHCGAPLHFLFGMKTGLRSYEVFVSDYRWCRYTPTKHRSFQNYEWVKAFSKALEPMVRKFPTQWFNLYPFFSDRPKGPPSRVEFDFELITPPQPNLLMSRELHERQL